MEKRVLKAAIEVAVRFSEVDSMGIVWHGSYAKYFEDAREEFGRQYHLGYLKIFGEGFYAPLVKLDFNYKKPLVYGDRMRIEIRYIPSAAAKICFEYAIHSLKEDAIIATGTSMQVFLDRNYELMLFNPQFYADWRVENGVDI